MSAHGGEAARVSQRSRLSARSGPAASCSDVARSTRCEGEGRGGARELLEEEDEVE